MSSISAFCEPFVAARGGDSHVRLLAVRGARKSNTAAVMPEGKFDAGPPFVVIDPIGSWFRDPYERCGLEALTDRKRRPYRKPTVERTVPTETEPASVHLWSRHWARVALKGRRARGETCSLPALRYCEREAFDRLLLVEVDRETRTDDTPGGYPRAPVTSIDATRTVFRTHRCRRSLARNELGEWLVASAAISDGQSFLRSDARRFAIGKGRSRLGEATVRVNRDAEGEMIRSP